MSEDAPGLGHNLPPLQEQLADETAEDKRAWAKLIAEVGLTEEQIYEHLHC